MSKNTIKWLVVSMVAVVVCGVALVLYLHGTQAVVQPSSDPSTTPSDTPAGSKAPDAPEGGAQSDQTTAEQPAVDQPATVPVNSEIPAPNQPQLSDSQQMDQEDEQTGLVLQSVMRIAGYFVEDGSNELVEDVLGATIYNPTDRTVEYAVMTLSNGTNTYTFQISTLQPGAIIRVMETARRPYPSDAKELTADFSICAWFQEEPSRMEDLLDIEVQDHTITVTNLSDTELSGPVYIYYKNYADDVFIGGITYRAGTAGALAAGERYSIYANHFTVDGSRIVFVTDAQ